MTVLLLVFSPSANKLANDFTGTCKAGDIAGLEKYSVSQYSEYSDIIKELLAEAEADKLEFAGSSVPASGVSSSDVPNSNVSELDDRPSIQTVIMSSSEYKASHILTINGRAVCKMKITGPDMEQIFIDILLQSDQDGAELITQEQLYNKIVSACKEKKYVTESIVNIPMARLGGTWYFDIEQYEIIDALTGRVGKAYTRLYQQAFEQFEEYYRTGIENDEE